MKKFFIFFYQDDVELHIEADSMKEAHVKLSEKFGIKPHDVGYKGITFKEKPLV